MPTECQSYSLVNVLLISHEWLMKWNEWLQIMDLRGIYVTLFLVLSNILLELIFAGLQI